MPVIVFASPKGGVGKSTAAVLLASEIAEAGKATTLIDADPNRPMVIAWDLDHGFANGDPDDPREASPAEARVVELEAALSDPALFKERPLEVAGLNTRLEAARAEVERLYARWAELDAIPPA